MEADKIRMTQGPIVPTLLRFALPLFLGNLFQQLYNAVDALVVGNVCGDNALAAVSSAGSLCFLLIGFFQGVFVGASVLISRHFGAKDDEGVDKTIHTTVVFALGAGILLTVAGVLLTPVILGWMGTPENVMPNSVAYFQVWCSGLLGLVLYNTATGIFQALGDSRHPLYYLIAAALLNVVLDLLFVAGLGMGVRGAALATIIGQALSTVLAFAHLMSGRFLVQIKLSKLKVQWPILKRIFQLGIPSGVQNSVISIANVVVQSNINAFGDLAMAGSGSYAKIEGFVFLPITCLTMALTTFVGQNLGAGNRDRVIAGAKVGTLLTASLAELLGILFFIFAPFLIGLFSDSPEVVAYGVRQTRIESLFFCFLGFAHASASILRGAGRAVTPMAIMLCVWCLLRIAYITFMVSIFHDITVVYTAYPVTWSISCILFTWSLLRGHWLE